jgi:hypothetical protein
MRRIITMGFASVVCAAALALPTASAAQNPPAGRAGRQPADQLSPRDVADMLDAYAVVQAQDNLQLNDTQYGQFVTRLRRLQQTRRQNQQARNQMLGEIRRLLNPPPSAAPQGGPAFDEVALRDRLKALRELDERSAAEVRKAYDALDEVMDARQQARFRLFEEQLERRKLDLLMRARQAARRGGSESRIPDR